MSEDVKAAPATDPPGLYPQPAGPAAPTWRERWLTGSVVDSLHYWVGSRLGVYLAAFLGLAILRTGPSDTREDYLAQWNRWDAILYGYVARDGYFGYPDKYNHDNLEAFFPGLPLVLRAVNLLGVDLVLAGLIVSFVAGAIAMVALTRLGDLEKTPGTGSRAVLYLILSPYAVFLAAGYSEALFLAFALPAWLMARRGRWQDAAVLTAFSCLVRVTGVFLAAALVVEYVVSRRRAKLPLFTWNLPWFALPAVPIASYFLYLHGRTDTWTAWFDAQREQWHRDFTMPHKAWELTWNAAFHQPGTSSDFVWAWRAEIVAVLIGLALVGVLGWLRRWGELTYVGLTVAALATSTWYFSVPRATLLWWPLWLLLAGAGLRRRWVHTLYLSVAAPLMVVLTLAFTASKWVN